MTVVGAKNGAGVYQRIISLIPPHDVYIEPFAGSGAILRHKRLARRSIAIDLDPGAIATLEDARSRIPQLELIVGDGVEYLRHMSSSAGSDVFVYADPPYVRSSRRDAERDYYEHDWTDAQHEEFLELVVSLPWKVMISGYPSSLYASLIDRTGWWATSFPTATRGGPAEEWLWMNYPQPERLHDYRYIGDDFPERWRIHKRQRSWLCMLDGMPVLERRAMLASIIDANAAEVLTYLDGDGAGRRDGGVDAGSRRDGGVDGRPASRMSMRPGRSQGSAATRATVGSVDPAATGTSGAPGPAGPLVAEVTA